MAVKYLVPDGKHLPYTDDSGKPDHHLMGAAFAALHGGYRGNRYLGPDKSSAIEKLRGIYKEEGMNWPADADHSVNAKDAITCAAIEMPVTAAQGNEIVYLPTGLHPITPTKGGIGKAIKVLVTRSAAAEIEKRRAAIVAKGKRPYFDFNHEDGEASFWPTNFFWREGEGVIAAGDWSGSGRRSVQDKDYCAFSPVFYVDDPHGDPAHVMANEKNFDPNMGGLVNNPAFKDLPLWAKNSGDEADLLDSSRSSRNDNDMKTSEEIAALKAKEKELTAKVEELQALVAKDKNDQVSAARLEQARAEQKLIAAELKNAELESANSKQGEAIKARNKSDAEAAVQDAIKRGAILAKDEKTKTALIDQATSDPAFIEVIKAMQGNPTLVPGRITHSPNGDRRVEVTATAPREIITAYAKIVAANSKIKLERDGSTAKQKGELARQAAAIFATDIEKNKAIELATDQEMIAIAAADNVDVAVGLLAGTLIIQRSLPLLQFEYPVLTSVMTDFSDQPGLFQQTETTRIVLKPAVQAYDATTDTAGRPKGWDVVSPAQDVDVSITLDEHIGVPIVFGVQTLAQTMRRLFEENAPQAVYAIGGYFVKKMAALLTASNYPAYKTTAGPTVTTVSGSNAVTVTTGDTTSMYPGQAFAEGTPGTNWASTSTVFVKSIQDSTHFTTTQKAIAGNAGVVLTLGPGFYEDGTLLPIPDPMATYAEAVGNFNMASLNRIAAIFDSGMVPQNDRVVLLNAAYYMRLANDPVLNTFFAAMKSPEIITKGTLPELQGFVPQKAPWFPSSSNRVGFAFHKSAVLLKSRLPVDFTQAVGAMVPGSVTTITAPSGITVLLVQYVNLTSNYAEWRPEIMLGAALGERRAGLVITSQ